LFASQPQAPPPGIPPIPGPPAAGADRGGKLAYFFHGNFQVHIFLSIFLAKFQNRIFRKSQI
jgi:hypothetical protein